MKSFTHNEFLLLIVAFLYLATILLRYGTFALKCRENSLKELNIALARIISNSQFDSYTHGKLIVYSTTVMRKLGSLFFIKMCIDSCFYHRGKKEAADLRELEELRRNQSKIRPENKVIFCALHVAFCNIGLPWLFKVVESLMLRSITVYTPSTDADVAAQGNGEFHNMQTVIKFRPQCNGKLRNRLSDLLPV